MITESTRVIYERQETRNCHSDSKSHISLARLTFLNFKCVALLSTKTVDTPVLIVVLQEPRTKQSVNQTELSSSIYITEWHAGNIQYYASITGYWQRSAIVRQVHRNEKYVISLNIDIFDAIPH